MKSLLGKSLPAIGVLLALAGHTIEVRPAAAQQAADTAFDWRQEWALAEGLNIEIDSQGFQLPTALAFVPNPGTAPNSPLYFVTELKGKVKVVTNDRSVHIFAEEFLPNPQGEGLTQFGAAGICLDPANGYVFATFAYLDDTNVFRNGIARFGTTIETFDLAPRATTIFLDLFTDEISSASHQIGPCQVKDGLLYMTVGYGEDRTQSQNLHSTLGSVIRMTTDFEPVADNPFYQDDGEDTAIDYIWAYGFRNPFGLRFVGDRLFVTENGGSIDRFNEIEIGENYLWDGTDWSIGARAVQVFAPSMGLVQLDYLAETNDLFPEQFRGKFYMVSAGIVGGSGPGPNNRRSLLMLDYNFEERRMNRAPRVVLAYRGEGLQLPVNVTLGPDGMYMLPLLPDQTGMSAVLKIRYDPDADYPYRLGENLTPQALINEYGCRQCHDIDGRGGTVGPPLDDILVSRLGERLNTPEYRAQVTDIDKLENEPFTTFYDARHAIIAASGPDRVRLWLETYLQEPRFDNPEVEMASVGVTREHASTIANYLLDLATREPEELSALDEVRFVMAHAIPELRYRHMLFSFAFGAIAATAGLASIYMFFRRRRGRR